MEAFGERLGAKLKGGEVIELKSDLGGGKTTLTRGIARGAGSKSVVASPTFTISKVYHAPTLDVHHFDFYRLQEAGLIAHELHDVLDDPRGVVVIEWGDVVQDVLPRDRLTITIDKTLSGGRMLSCAYPETLGYLLG